MNYICISNYVGGEPLQYYYNFVTNLINRKGTQLEFLTQCFSGIADPLQKRLIIAWAADKYAQSVTTLQPSFSKVNKPK